MVKNLLLLLLAIVFEICGDASIRIGLRGSKLAPFLGGVVLVILYGTLISFPSWDFSRTMGIYIAMFFIVSQIVARFVLHERLLPPTMVGGLFIVCGGVIILVWKPA